MNNNLILYETHYGSAKKAAEIFSLVLGYAKMYNIRDYHADSEGYGRLIFIFGFHGNDTAEKIINYIVENKEKIINKEIILVGIGLEKDDIKNYAKKVTNALGRNADYVDFIHGEIRTKNLTADDKAVLESFFEEHNIILTDMGKFKKSEACEVAEKYYYIIKSKGRKIEKGELEKACFKYLSEHNTCALCTGTQDFVRSTPLEYVVKDNSIYLITEGGMKFYSILQNKNVSVSVFENYKGMGKLKGMQLTGTADLVEYFSDEYIEVLKCRNIKAEMVKGLPVNLNVVRIKITRIEYLNSEFKKKGYDSSQILEVE